MKSLAATAIRQAQLADVVAHSPTPDPLLVEPRTLGMCAYTLISMIRSLWMDPTFPAGTVDTRPSWRRKRHDLGMKSRVHPKYKTKYRVWNWPEYERVLVRRGDITRWLSAVAIDAWTPSPSGRRARRGSSRISRSRQRCRCGSYFIGLGYPFNRSKLRGVGHPRAGTHYPRSVGEFQAWFRTDADCLDYLEWLRWPAGFACSGCGRDTGWRLADGRYMCSKCGGRTSVTAGTIFDRTRTPLTVWFTACWLFATGKDGISALSLKRTLEIGSYQTAWAMLHRLRSVLVRPGRDRLAGLVEVDETFIGGEESGLRGGRARGKKVLTGIAVEVREPTGLGRCRMRPLADASAVSLHAFVTDHVEPGARVITDGWQGYRGLEKLGYVHQRRSQRAARTRGDPGELLPAVHRVASLIKRWLLGTHQGSVDTAHLTSYLNEFVFRFNRRRSRSRGMVFYRVLELAVAHDPVRYRDLIVDPTPKMKPPAPPRTRGHPASLERPPANRPWRVASPASASSG